jgi:hypothetical protein
MSAFWISRGLNLPCGMEPSSIAFSSIQSISSLEPAASLNNFSTFWISGDSRTGTEDLTEGVAVGWSSVSASSSLSSSLFAFGRKSSGLHGLKLCGNGIYINLIFKYKS